MTGPRYVFRVVVGHWVPTMYPHTHVSGATPGANVPVGSTFALNSHIVRVTGWVPSAIARLGSGSTNCGMALPARGTCAVCPSRTGAGSAAAASPAITARRWVILMTLGLLPSIGHRAIHGSTSSDAGWPVEGLLSLPVELREDRINGLTPAHDADESLPRRALSTFVQ